MGAFEKASRNLATIFFYFGLDLKIRTNTQFVRCRSPSDLDLDHSRDKNLDILIESKA